MDDAHESKAPLLTQEEIAHFKREGEVARPRCPLSVHRLGGPFPELYGRICGNGCPSDAGYVIKYGLLDQELMRKMRERLFAGSAEFGGRITAGDPSSWVGPLLPEEEYACQLDLKFLWLRGIHKH